MLYIFGEAIFVATFCTIFVFDRHEMKQKKLFLFIQLITHSIISFHFISLLNSFLGPK